MAYMSTIAGSKVAISMSESPDMSFLGLSDAHLRDAMNRVALPIALVRRKPRLRGRSPAVWLYGMVVRIGKSLPARNERSSDWRDQLPCMAGPYTDGNRRT